MTTRSTLPPLSVRNARPEDAQAIANLIAKVYPPKLSYPAETVLGPMTAFPQGQFVVEDAGQIIGYAATFITDEATAMSKHTWPGITNNGMASNHNPDGDWLYGMEVCVDPDQRGQRIGQRLYVARKRLATRLKLKGIIFGGRMPAYTRHQKRFPTPEAYLEAAVARKVRDPVISFQRRNGFLPLGVLRNYMPGDTESADLAAHMMWRNPKHPDTPPSFVEPTGSTI
ncbi:MULTISPECIES: GNAT family N-acetyltransferase [unclassified Minwuia]|jgi:ribosomal protein S18 acetylase RimI-like enzyme|uniref:GNAT family N-acetyltransferase n=1 Tax=unclassified Minwuia TaxID=2618799 RepID=UPI00247A9C43|nr:MULTISPECIES: GNAT family N-acetyltransferase [unclassified Minwuia]